MEKVSLKRMFGHSICIVVAVVLHFALSGNAYATSITWQFNNTPQTVSPTDTIAMTISVNLVNDNLNQVIITGFMIAVVDPGTLIGQVNGSSIDSPTNPYNLVFNVPTCPLPCAIDYGFTTNIPFGDLLPIGGSAPFGTFTSGPGTALIFYNFDKSYTTQVTGQNTFTVNVVPEPSTILLLASGLAGLGFFRMRRKREA